MRSFRLRLAGLAVGSVLLALVASPALADTESGHHGLVGTHSLRDTIDKPGVTCTYKPRNGIEGVPFSLFTVRVRPPIVFGRSASSQKTGWRFTLERKLHTGTTWSAVLLSGIQQAPATSLSAANFVAMTHKVPLPTLAADYRVEVTMFWYHQGAIEGSATHLVDFYRRVSPDENHVVGPVGACLRRNRELARENGVADLRANTAQRGAQQ